MSIRSTAAKIATRDGRPPPIASPSRPHVRSARPRAQPRARARRIRDTRTVTGTKPVDPFADHFDCSSRRRSSEPHYARLFGLQPSRSARALANNSGRLVTVPRGTRASSAAARGRAGAARRLDRRHRPGVADFLVAVVVVDSRFVASPAGTLSPQSRRSMPSTLVARARLAPASERRESDGPLSQPTTPFSSRTDSWRRQRHSRAIRSRTRRHRYRANAPGLPTSTRRSLPACTLSPLPLATASCSTSPGERRRA